jgi:hypothetical protein
MSLSFQPSKHQTKSEILRFVQNDSALAGTIQLTTSTHPSQTPHTTVLLAPLGRGEPHRTVILPRPVWGSRVCETPLSCAAKAGPASFRGRVRGSRILQLHRSGLGFWGGAEWRPRLEKQS